MWAEADDRPVITMVSSGQPDVLITRTRFQMAVRAQAALLQASGIGPGDLVIVAHDQDLNGIYRFWAAILLGAVPSFFPPLTEKMNPTVYQENMSTLVDHSAAKVVLTSDLHVALLAATVSCPVLGDGQVTEIGAAGTTYRPQPDAVAFLQHSSGTTGLQKGVALSHRAVLNQLAHYSEAIGLRPQDVIVSWLPLYHDMGLIATFLLPLIQGVHLVLLSPFDWVRRPAVLLEAIARHQGSLCWLPNFAFNHMARRVRARETEGLSLHSMRQFINCSEPVRADSHHLFWQRFAQIGVRPEMFGVSYAMAENTFAVTQTRMGQAARVVEVDAQALAERQAVEPVGSTTTQQIVSCGHPIEQTSIRIVDATGENLPERYVGEIVLKSDCMLSGYYRRPDLAPFQNGWYQTGDRGFLLDGELYVVGRSKDLIINAGKNIYPQDIEAIVNQIEGVHPGRVVAFGVPDAREGTELIAVMAEVDSEDPATRKVINQRIRQTIAQKSMVAVTFVELVPPKTLLKTSSGKIARAANRERWQRRRSS